MNEEFKKKYLKYKIKYLELIGGSNIMPVINYILGTKNYGDPSTIDFIFGKSEHVIEEELEKIKPEIQNSINATDSHKLEKSIKDIEKQDFKKTQKEKLKKILDFIKGIDKDNNNKFANEGLESVIKDLDSSLNDTASSAPPPAEPVSSPASPAPAEEAPAEESAGAGAPAEAEAAAEEPAAGESTPPAEGVAAEAPAEEAPAEEPLTEEAAAEAAPVAEEAGVGAQRQAEQAAPPAGAQVSPKLSPIPPPHPKPSPSSRPQPKSPASTAATAAINKKVLENIRGDIVSNIRPSHNCSDIEECFKSLKKIIKNTKLSENIEDIKNINTIIKKNTVETLINEIARCIGQEFDENIEKIKEYIEENIKKIFTDDQLYKLFIFIVIQFGKLLNYEGPVITRMENLLLLKHNFDEESLGEYKYRNLDQINENAIVAVKLVSGKIEPGKVIKNSDDELTIIIRNPEPRDSRNSSTEDFVNKGDFKLDEIFKSDILMVDTSDFETKVDTYLRN